MSNLIIKGIPTAVINPAFTDAFALVAESDGSYNADILAYQVYLNPSDAEQAESEDITAMAFFMLKTGSLMGVKWDSRFYFGDVDLMDMYSDTYLDDAGTICLQHDLEVKPWAKCVLCDAIIDGEAVDFRGGHVHTSCCLKFVAFQATGKDVSDLKAFDIAGPGRVYLSNGSIFLEKNSDSSYYIQLGNCEYESMDLLDIEIRLYNWAQSEGYCDRIGLKLDWCDWNSGGNYMIWSHEFVDGKSIHVTNEEFTLASIPTSNHFEKAFNGEFDQHLVTATLPKTKDEIAFLLIPFLGQELADITAADIHFIVETW